MQLLLELEALAPLQLKAPTEVTRSSTPSRLQVAVLVERVRIMTPHLAMATRAALAVAVPPGVETPGEVGPEHLARDLLEVAAGPTEQLEEQLEEEEVLGRRAQLVRAPQLALAATVVMESHLQ
jgi:hypothetical protein